MLRCTESRGRKLKKKRCEERQKFFNHRRTQTNLLELQTIVASSPSRRRFFFQCTSLDIAFLPLWRRENPLAHYTSTSNRLSEAFCAVFEFASSLLVPMKGGKKLSRKLQSAKRCCRCNKNRCSFSFNETRKTFNLFCAWLKQLFIVVISPFAFCTRRGEK